jgi:hypothetical protein
MTKPRPKISVRIKRRPNPPPGQGRGQPKREEDDRAGLDRLLGRTQPSPKPKGR